MKILGLGCGLLVLLGAASPAAAQSSPRGGVPLVRQAASVAQITQTVQDVVGPMPAIAGTPFFGLALLSGAALASDSDWVAQSKHPWVQAFRDNALIAESRRYSSWPLFLSLLALAAVLYLANTGKIRGAVGKLLRTAEDSSVFVTYTLLAVATLVGVGAEATIGASGASAPAPVAAIGAMPASALIGLGVAVGMALMMVVRYACDVMIWLIPVPFIDFLFETAKKVITLGFLALYFWSPVAAATLSLGVVLIAFLLYGWATRMLHFSYGIVLRPWWDRLAGFPDPQLVNARLARRVVGDAEPVELAAPAAVLALRGFPKRRSGILLKTGSGLSFATAPWFRPPRRAALPAPGQRLVLYRTLLWLELRILDQNGKVTGRIALSRTFVPHLDRLRQLLGAEDGGSLGLVRLLEPVGPAAVPVPG